MKKNQLERRAVAILKNVLNKIGLDNLTSEIIANLWVAPNEIGMDELAQKTGYSLSSISLKLKQLGDLHGIQKINKPGSKKKYLYMKKDPIELWLAKVESTFGMISSKLKKTMPALITEYKGQVKNESEKQIIANMANYINRIDKLEEILKKINLSLKKEAKNG